MSDWDASRRPAHSRAAGRGAGARSRPRDGEPIIDGTFGAGGYTRAILEAADCRVHGARPRSRGDRGGGARARRAEFDAAG